MVRYDDVVNDDLTKEKYNVKISLDVLKQLVNQIKDGVLEGNKVRKFDIIDYYEKIDLPFKILYRRLYIYNKLNCLSQYDYSLVSRFILSQQACMFPTTIDSLMNINFIFGDRVISLEEKKYVIDQLTDCCIPVDSATFVTGIRRYANNIEIKKSNNEDKKLTKNK